MLPVQHDGKWTVIVKIIADYIGGLLGDFLPFLCLLIITTSAVMGILSLKKPWFSYPVLEKTFSTTYVWVIIRVIGAVLIWLTYFGVGAGDSKASILHMITANNAGGFVLHDLLSVLVIIFFIAGLLLPLLLDFGLLEFIGALLTKVMRPLFSIPGRAAVDCITSWIGDGTLGVMLTSNQYEQGYYSKREAAVISTTYSAVSITFSIVVLAQVNLMGYFGVYYMLICLIGIACALIIPRIPPLSRKNDEYLVPGKAMGEDIPSEFSSTMDYGLYLARQRVAEFRGAGQFLQNGFRNAAGMWFGVLPVVMCIGTISLVLANNTDLFEILGKPFLPLLEFLNVPQAVETSKTMIVGFTDMFTPSIIAAESISDPMARFIVAVVSVTQLIYLSEVGGLILGSIIPINLFELFILFLERTIISLLIAAPVAHIIFA